MTMSSRSCFFVFVAAAAVACATSSDPDLSFDPTTAATGDDAGGVGGGANDGAVSSAPDGGSTVNGGGTDSGGSADSGGAATDAGSASDAAVPVPDASQPDTGSPVVDAGTGGGVDAAPPTGVFGGAPPYVSKSGGDGHHNAGRACFQCHGFNGPSFTVGGTVYGASGQALSNVEVRVVDSTGAAFSVYSGTNGNFYKLGNPLSAASNAGVRDATSTSEMVATTTSGDCNSCHCTGSGCTAPRIHLP